jgi:hypothetical protein
MCCCPSFKSVDQSATHTVGVLSVAGLPVDTPTATKIIHSASSVAEKILAGAATTVAAAVQGADWNTGPVWQRLWRHQSRRRWQPFLPLLGQCIAPSRHKSKYILNILPFFIISSIIKKSSFLSIYLHYIKINIGKSLVHYKVNYSFKPNLTFNQRL